jgi:hypothetical protein
MIVFQLPIFFKVIFSAFPLSTSTLQKPAIGKSCVNENIVKTGEITPQRVTTDPVEYQTTQRPDVGGGSEDIPKQDLRRRKSWGCS